MFELPRLCAYTSAQGGSWSTSSSITWGTSTLLYRFLHQRLDAVVFVCFFFGGNCCSQLHCSNLQPCLSDWQGSNALAGTTYKGRWLLSPSHFGWPANRPRLYTLLVKKGPVALRNGGVRLMNKLYRIPLLSVDKLMVAPQESSLDGKISWFLSCSAALLALILICEHGFP